MPARACRLHSCRSSSVQLDVEPQRRFESAGEMEAALEAVLIGGSIRSSPESNPSRAQPRGRVAGIVRRPMPAWTGIGLVLLGFLVNRLWPDVVPSWPHRTAAAAAR